MRTLPPKCVECQKALREGDEYYMTDAKGEHPRRYWHKACFDATLTPLPVLYRKNAVPPLQKLRER
jgi:hypothetical protein